MTPDFAARLGFVERNGEYQRLDTVRVEKDVIQCYTESMLPEIPIENDNEVVFVHKIWTKADHTNKMEHKDFSGAHFEDGCKNPKYECIEHYPGPYYEKLKRQLEREKQN